MNNEQEAKLTMYHEVDGMLNDESNNATTLLLPDFAGLLTEFEGNTQTIEQNRAVQDANTTGVAAGKEEQRNTFEQETFFMGNKVAAWATIHDTAEVVALAACTKSDLAKMTDGELVSKGLVVFNLATANVASLSGYGIDATRVTAYGTMRTDFNALIGKPQEVKEVKSTATDVVADTIAAQDKLLEEKMDRIVRASSDLYPQFATLYFKARHIPDHPSHVLNMRVKAVDFDTNAPLGFVVVTVSPDNAKRKTKEKGGGCNYLHLTEGNKVVTGEKPGYQKAAANSAVTHGERADVVLRMHKV